MLSYQQQFACIIITCHSLVLTLYYNYIKSEPPSDRFSYVQQIFPSYLKYVYTNTHTHTDTHTHTLIYWLTYNSTWLLHNIWNKQKRTQFVSCSAQKQQKVSITLIFQECSLPIWSQQQQNKASSLCLIFSLSKEEIIFS